MTRKSGLKKERESLFSTPVVAMWLVFGIPGLYGFLQVDMAQFDEEANYTSERSKPGYPNIFTEPKNNSHINQFYRPTRLEGSNLSIFIPKGRYGIHHYRNQEAFEILLSNQSGILKEIQHSGDRSGWGISATSFAVVNDTFATLTISGRVVLRMTDASIDWAFDSQDNNENVSFPGPYMTFMIEDQSLHKWEDPWDSVFEITLHIRKTGEPYDLIVYDLSLNTLYQGFDFSTIDSHSFIPLDPEDSEFLFTIYSQDGNYELMIDISRERLTSKQDQYVKAGFSTSLIAIPAAITIFLWAERRAMEGEN